MNREIKFRAWDKRQTKGLSTQEMLYDAQKHHLWYDVIDYPDTYVAMQFTGLKDKNNREIYEGDIVLAEFLDESQTKKVAEKNVVVFSDGAFILKHVSLWNNEWNGGALMLGQGDLQVIGNIFENPELLTENNKV